MTWTSAQPRDDELDTFDSADRTLQDLREDLTELTEAELESAAGVESPPGRID